MIIKSWLPGRGGDSAVVSPFLFGFMPGVQHCLVAGDVGELSDEQNRRVHDLAGAIAAEMGSARFPFGLSCRLGESRLLLLGIPVTAVEAASSRSGLSVTLGCVLPGAAAPELWVQVFAAMGMAVSRMFSLPYAGMQASVEYLARRLQETDGGATQRDLGHALTRLGSSFSVLATQKFVGDSGSVIGGFAHDPAYVVMKVLARSAKVDRRDVTARFLPLSAVLDGGLDSLAKSSLLHFSVDGIVVCGPFD